MPPPILQPVGPSDRHRAQATHATGLLLRQPRRAFTQRVDKRPKTVGSHCPQAGHKDGGRQQIEHAAKHAERCHVEKEKQHHIPQAGWALCGTGLPGVRSRQGPISVGVMVSLVLLVASPCRRGAPLRREGRCDSFCRHVLLPKRGRAAQKSGQDRDPPNAFVPHLSIDFLCESGGRWLGLPVSQSIVRISLRSRTLRTRPRSWPRRRICPSIATTA